MYAADLGLTPRNRSSVPQVSDTMVCVGDDPGALTGILQPETGIAILRRFPAAAIVREVEKLGAGALPGNKVRLDRDSSGTDIAGLLAAHDLDPAGFQAWIRVSKS
jgi:hypothetical protein